MFYKKPSHKAAGSQGVLFRNLILVSGSNAVQLLANIMLGLLLPVLLDVDDFGYYKIYTLYVGYCGLLHFGFIDGVLLRFGGQEYQALDKAAFRTYTRLFVLCEAVCSVLIIAFGYLALEGPYQILAIVLGSNLMLQTVPQYYQYLSQATSRFREFSMRKFLRSLATILVVLVLFAVKKLWKDLPFWFVIVTLQGVSLFMLVWYVWTYRDITFGKGAPVRTVLPSVLEMCRKGFLLTIAYEAAQFLLLLDRQFVSLLFPIAVYAQYAFAYNLLSCVNALITAFSTVLFPMLKKMRREQAMTLLSPGTGVVTVLVCLSLSGYYVIEILLNLLLPRYGGSLEYFQIVFPAMALSGSITIVMFTFYKVLDRIFEYFKCSLLALAAAFVLNAAAYAIWKTPSAISVASVLSVILWYVLVSGNLSGICGVSWVKNFVYGLSAMVLFYLTLRLPCSAALRCTMYLSLVIPVTCIVYRDLPKVLKQARQKGML